MSIYVISFLKYLRILFVSRFLKQKQLKLRKLNVYFIKVGGKLCLRNQKNATHQTAGHQNTIQGHL